MVQINLSILTSFLWVSIANYCSVQGSHAQVIPGLENIDFISCYEGDRHRPKHKIHQQRQGHSGNSLFLED
ncbi:hypothetical protein R3P38DRAFT_2921160 [Favolaschia claudopus]|uniref:Secreted protein n=1 Tax=Favolaschia claudopus TaxID=2862362 RepID=A0AAW0C3C4_9AGAR